MKKFPTLALLPLLLFSGSCQSPASNSEQLSLFDGYGGYQRSVSHASGESQVWMDQALQLVYGFNHDEAIRSFAHAAELAPDCAMAWWGVAYGSGIDVNNPAVTDDEAKRGYEAAVKAMALAAQVSPEERALIHAVSKRAVWPLPADRGPLDQAYADAMQESWVAFPHDPDVGALYAEALMNLQPWAYWTADGKALGRTHEILSVLESVLREHPLHPGANHFYIHAVEASSNPGLATISADRLRNLVPGSGHLVHMPSHIYINTGRYNEAVTSNKEAIKADEAYFAEIGDPGFYSLYYIHNIHFLAFGAMMEGRAELAIDATRRMEQQVPESFLLNFPAFADGLMPAKFHALIRFGRWQEILDEPIYPEFRKVSRAMRSYARVVALANLKRTQEAREELAIFDQRITEVPEDWFIGTNPASIILVLSRQMAVGEILWREGKQEEAFAQLREAVAAEDQLVYDEPPGWMLPVRHALGAILLAAGEAAQAEQVYREDLIDWQENAWSLLGLEQSLREQGRNAEADELKPRVTAAWARADVVPPASCYCGVTE